MLDRRAFCGVMGSAAAALAGCGFDPADPSANARLETRPAAPDLTITPGVTDVTFQGVTEAKLYVPSTYSASTPAPLFVAFHGAGGNVDSFGSFVARTEARGILMLVVGSRADTWDAITGSYGADVAAIDRSLRYTYRHAAVDAARTCVGGFSDGASYALGIGLNNGDFLTRIIAFSPGFAPPFTLRGTPDLFISHGTDDTVLPIADTSRRIVADLRGRGLIVDYTEFAGGHQVPAAIADEAMDWMIA